MIADIQRGSQRAHRPRETSYPVAGKLPDGSLGWLTCQKAGTSVGSTTRIWDKLTDGRWVTDHYVATPSNTAYSKPAPRC